MRDDYDKRRPEEIESDLARTRTELSSTIDAIQSKLTPGQLMDQAFGYARTSLPADFGANLGNAVRDNPLPVALIGVGIAWLAMKGQNADGRARIRRQAADYDREYYGLDAGLDYDGGYGGDYVDGLGEGGSRDAAMRRTASRASGAAHDMKDRVSGAAHDMKDRVSGAAHEFGEKASETGRSLKDKASDVGHRLSERASEWTGRAGEMTHDARERMHATTDGARARIGELGHRSQQRYARARDSVGHVLEEQPLVLGAIGVAIGAMLGAALPATRREDEWMGHTRDDLVEGAMDTAREQVDHLKDSAQRVAHAAEQEVERVSEEASARARTQGNGHANRPAASADASASDRPGGAQGSQGPR
jgi:ElaB/YqjD/DUF883 family membrane-anchored ribosome-binding protein